MGAQEREVGRAEPGRGVLTDVTLLGVRLAVGVTFIVHGFGKIGNEGFVGWMSSYGIGPEMSMLIALGELVPGILLMIGVLNRISSAILAVIMIAAIIVVKGAASFAGSEDASGYEHDLILLAASLLIIVTGPGRVSLAQVISRLPRFLH